MNFDKQKESTMKAILTKFDENNSPVKTAGNDPDNRRLTKSYKSFAMLYRYAIVPALRQWNGRLKAEIWNGENIYSDPDRVQTWNNHIFSKGA
jgi:hypothetical protein